MCAQEDDLAEMQKSPEDTDVVATVHKSGAEGGHCARLAWWDDLKFWWQWCESFVAGENLGDGCVGGVDVFPFNDCGIICRWQVRILRIGCVGCWWRALVVRVCVVCCDGCVRSSRSHAEEIRHL